MAIQIPTFRHSVCPLPLRFTWKRPISFSYWGKTVHKGKYLVITLMNAEIIIYLLVCIFCELHVMLALLTETLFSCNTIYQFIGALSILGRAAVIGKYVFILLLFRLSHIHGVQ